jgi:hypothetical protein
MFDLEKLCIMYVGDGFMIAFWNKKEVFVGFSLERFNEVRQALSVSRIGYEYRLVNHNSAHVLGSRRARTGTFGEKEEYSVAYYVYVHRKDYENACRVLAAS